MILYLFVVLLVSILEIYRMKKQKLKKEIYIFVFCMLLASVIGVLYINDPYRDSLAGFILQMFNIKR